HVSAVDIRRTAPGAIGGGSGVTTMEFADNAFGIFDESDVTKIIKFQASGITTGNTRTYNAPDANGTLALLANVRGFIDGLTTELDTDTAHDVQVNAGACVDSLGSNNKIILVAAAFTKRIDAAWAVGDTNGGMATGTVANDTEYNIIIIEKDSDGTIDMMFDVSATGANVPAGYTARRRIGSVFTDGSANINAYKQSGDSFFYDVPLTDLNDATGTLNTWETATLSVPASTVAIIKAQTDQDTSPTIAGMRVRASGASGTPPAITLVRAVGAGASRLAVAVGTQFQVNASSQLEYTLTGDGAWNIATIGTLGWVDDRGRNA
ncbi:hypothetical protein LCGC14_1979490, partial [marine sediment metagenome]